MRRGERLRKASALAQKLFGCLFGGGAPPWVDDKAEAALLEFFHGPVLERNPFAAGHGFAQRFVMLSGVVGANKEGLRCDLCTADGRRQLVDCELSESLLVLHGLSGRRTQVRFSGSTWYFKTERSRFDYYPVGHYDLHDSGPEPSRAHVFRIPVAFERSVLDERQQQGLLLPRFQFHDRRLESLARSAIDGAANGLPSDETAVLAAAIVDRLHEVAASGAAEVPPGFSPTVRRLIVEYLDINLDANHGIERIAFLTGLARTQSGRAFRHSFGVPIHEYLIRRRIEVALKRLESPAASVTQIAHELGFSNHAHFTTVFRKRVGKTPSSYRAERLAGFEQAGADKKGPEDDAPGSELSTDHRLPLLATRS